MTMVHVYVVEDHPIMRELLREYMEQEPDLALDGEAATAAAALEQVAVMQPDLVLIDVSLPDMSGIELARVLGERHPELALMMLSGHGERRYVDQALEAGARGYVLKGRTEELLVGIRQVMRGERYLSTGVSASES